MGLKGVKWGYNISTSFKCHHSIIHMDVFLIFFAFGVYFWDFIYSLIGLELFFIVLEKRVLTRKLGRVSSVVIHKHARRENVGERREGKKREGRVEGRCFWAAYPFTMSLKYCRVTVQLICLYLNSNCRNNVWLQGKNWFCSISLATRWTAQSHYCRSWGRFETGIWSVI